MFLLPAGSSQSEPVDWLGFSRLGSPDSAPRDVPAGKDAAAAAEKPSATASAGKDVGRQTESSDGSSAVLARRTPALGRVPKTDKDDALRGSCVMTRLRIVRWTGWRWLQTGRQRRSQ